MRRRFRFRSATVAALGMGLVLAGCGGAPTADDTATGPVVDDSDTPEEPAGVDEPADTADESTDTADEPADVAAPSEASEDPADADEETASPAPPPTQAEDVVGDCSAAGATVDVMPAPDLPEEVAALRDFLLDAALRCDEQLLHTAIEESDQFTYSFGAEGDALGYWWQLEEAGDEPFLRLAQVLATTPAIAEGGDVIVWPRVATGRPEDTTAEAWSEVTWMEDPQQQAEDAGGYLGWRAGISTDGQWRFFVAGD